MTQQDKGLAGIAAMNAAERWMGNDKTGSLVTSRTVGTVECHVKYVRGELIEMTFSAPCKTFFSSALD